MKILYSYFLLELSIIVQMFQPWFGAVYLGWTSFIASPVPSPRSILSGKYVQLSKSLCYDFRVCHLQKLESSLFKFHVTLLAIFLRFEVADERNCDNKEEISLEVSLWQ